MNYVLSHILGEVLTIKLLMSIKELIHIWGWCWGDYTGNAILGSHD